MKKKRAFLEKPVRVVYAPVKSSESYTLTLTLNSLFTIQDYLRNTID